jgi:cathepsin L
MQSQIVTVLSLVCSVAAAPAVAAEEQKAPAPALYAEREAKASPQVKKVLAEVRAQVDAKKLTFTVGYTTALDRALDKLAGTRKPANIKELAARQNKLAGELRRVDADTFYDSWSKIDKSKVPFFPLACNVSGSYWDWRLSGDVTPVHDQGNCGSCWAFGTIGAYEGSYSIRVAHDPDAAEQCVLSCSGAGTCDGGWWAFDHMISMGVSAETAYPYTATDTACKPVPKTYYVTTWGYVIPTGGIPSVDEMKAALCEHGPLAIAVRATNALVVYTGGVFNEKAAGPINHAITLIGWNDTKHAWLIKNSWGTGWGEGGFGWIDYDSNSVGDGAAWVDARRPLYKLPEKYWKLLPFKAPIPDPGPLTPGRTE